MRDRASPPASRPNLLEWKLAGVSEPCAAVALASFRSLTRAPEVKMILLTPLLIFGMINVSLLTSRVQLLPVRARPFAVLSITGLTLFGLMGLLQNQFGFDRSAFRAFVLSGVSRREILLGKNLGLAPILLGTGLFVLTVMQYRLPMQLSHFLASVLQVGSIALLSLGAGNLSSILVPWGPGAGSQKPASPRGLKILCNALFFSPCFLSLPS